MCKFVRKVNYFQLDTETTYNPIVFYDGDCGFCNASVQFILNKKRKNVYFVALQSEKAQKLLGPYKINIDLNTIYLLKDSKIYDRSSAGLQICKLLRGLYPILFVFYVVPKFLRDPFYNFIAKRRHKLRAGYCLIPAEADKKLFLQ